MAELSDAEPGRILASQQAREWLRADLASWTKTLVNRTEKDLALCQEDVDALAGRTRSGRDP